MLCELHHLPIDFLVQLKMLLWIAMIVCLGHSSQKIPASRCTSVQSSSANELMAALSRSDIKSSYSQPEIFAYLLLKKKLKMHIISYNTFSYVTHLGRT